MERFRKHITENDEVDGYGLLSAFLCRMCRIFLDRYYDLIL